MNRKDSITVTQRELQRGHVLNHLIADQCSVEDAAQLLGVSVRHVWRLKSAYVHAGTAALIHGNRGKESPTKISEDMRQRIVTVAREQYADCNDSHLVELLALREGIIIKRESLRRILRAAGIVARRPRRAPRHRRRRDRMPQAGMLVQIDASSHSWFGERGPKCALLGAIDDATSEVMAALFRPTEDAQGYFLLLRQILDHKGVPDALYHDRHGIFQRDPQTPWSLEEELSGYPFPTQFGRALETLGIESIAARTPQAKGRVERLWGTLQDRLVVELRLADICTLEAANAFLPGFLARHNAQFAVHADDPGQVYRPLDAGLDIERILSFQYTRLVNNDNTVHFDGQVLQIPPSTGGRSYAQTRVTVHELLDGRIGVWYNDRWLLRTDAPAAPPTLRARSSARTRPSTGSKAPKQLSFRAILDRARAAQPAMSHSWRRSGKMVRNGKMDSHNGDEKQASLTKSSSS